MWVLIDILIAFVLWTGRLEAQNSECGTATKSRDVVTLTAYSWNPVLAMGRALGMYGVSVSIESPRWAFPFDTENVADADPIWSSQHNNAHYLLMKRHLLELQFEAPRNSTPADIPHVLHQLSDAANKEMPYTYRLDATDGEYALVPTTTLNAAGKLEDVQPLLDHRLTIPLGQRSIAAHAELMAKQLSEQTGLHVSCCESVVAGIPWGMQTISFEAHDKAAREIVRTLIHLEDEENSKSPSHHPSYDHYSVNCDGTGAPWCFIEVASKYSFSCP